MTQMADIIEDKLCNDVSKYLSLRLQQDKFRTPQFYGMPTPRPVISQCGSILRIVSTCIDYEMVDVLLTTDCCIDGSA